MQSVKQKINWKFNIKIVYKTYLFIKWFRIKQSQSHLIMEGTLGSQRTKIFFCFIFFIIVSNSCILSVQCLLRLYSFLTLTNCSLHRSMNIWKCDRMGKNLCMWDNRLWLNAIIALGLVVLRSKFLFRDPNQLNIENQRYNMGGVLTRYMNCHRADVNSNIEMSVIKPSFYWDCEVFCSDLQTIKCQKVVLSRLGPNIERKFNKPEMPCTTIFFDVDIKTARMVVEYGLTACCELTLENTPNLYQFACSEKLFEIIEYCETYLLKQLKKKKNCFLIYHIALQGRQHQFVHDVRKFILLNFTELVMSLLNNQTNDMLNADYNDLFEILDDDHLQIRPEDRVFDVIQQWIETSSEERIQHFGKLINACRLSFLSELYRNDMIPNWLKRNSKRIPNVSIM